MNGWISLSFFFFFVHVAFCSVTEKSDFTFYTTHLIFVHINNLPLISLPQVIPT